MEIYKNFAAVYDLFMDEVPYTEWCRQIKTLLLSAGIKSGIVADLGCERPPGVAFALDGQVNHAG